MAKEVTINADGSKTIIRSVIFGTGDVPTVRLLPDMGLKKGDMMEITITKEGEVTGRKLK